MVRISSLTAILSYAIVLCGIVPLFPWLAIAPKSALAAGMLAGIWQDRRGAWPLKNWIFNAAIIPVFLYYAMQFSRTNPVQPVVSVLAVMLAVRMCGEKSIRHYLQIQALSLFCLASSSLFDLSPVFLFYLIVMLLLVAVSLVLLTFLSQDSRLTLSRAELRKVLAAGLLIPLASLPLLIFFFPILPRTQMPLWVFLTTPPASQAGFSDKVETGATATAGESHTLAFRAEMPRLSQQQLYWRASVFNRIEGQRWVRDGAVPAEQLHYNGARIHQTIFPEPGASRVLVALDAPMSVTAPRVRAVPDAVFEYAGTAGRRTSYGAESVTTAVLHSSGGFERGFYLRLPSDLPERVKQLAEEIRRQGGSDVRRMELLEQHFRNGGYRYSMTGLPTGEHALEQFLFDKKQGHCEFFASSFGLILRAVGIPARLVGGYLGGEYNELGGYYLISNDLAHVWVEAYLNGRGWVRIDPSSFARNAGQIWGALKRPGLVKKLRLALDSLDHTWNRTVITYDFERQLETAVSVEKQLHTFNSATLFRVVLPYTLALAVLAAIVLVLFRRPRLFAPQEERLLRRFYRRVEHDCGVRPEPGRQGLFELARKTGNQNVLEFVQIYAGALYRDRKLSDDEVVRLRKMLEDGFTISVQR
ncbi:MAG: DUF3488 and transglutaminase-like domain-containing protein [Desulfuromonadales bacterium]